MGDVSRETSHSRWFGVLTVVLALLGWSIVPIILRDLGPRVDPWSNNGWRYGASALFWLPWLIWTWKREGVRRGIFRDAFWPSVANVVGQSCFTAAFVELNPGLVTFCLRTQLVFVAILAWMMFPAERGVMRTPRFIGGVSLVLIGVLPVLLGGNIEWTGASLNGVLYALGSAVGYACYGIFVRKWMQRDHPITAFAVIAQQTAIGLILIMLVMGKDSGMAIVDLSERDLWLLGIAAFIGITVGHVFYYISIARLGVSVTSGVLQLQPFLVSAISLQVFQERLTPLQWFGGVVAIGGAAIMLTAKGKGSRDLAQAASDPGD
ncbi:MAG: DMT family transporter [Planctomycetota bacterium]|nr:DMT family transporter [Planctomycetota bacterium]